MKLFIWEGEGISSAYHDDGTLVVLAETAELARALVRAEKERLAQVGRDYGAAVKAWKARNPDPGRPYNGDYWNRLYAEVPGPWPDDTRRDWDGSDEALDREPDRVIELDTPTVVAFNGGGYD